MFSGDFVKLTSASPSSTGDDWTDAEVLLLLEAIELFDDDWGKVEEHVGSRSAQQCIRKFLELPIEDPYLNAEADKGPLRFGRVPFEQADNPVMSVVAFLAGVVGPGVAADAAKTALHTLVEGDGKEAGKADTEQENDKMEEDARPQESKSEEPSEGAEVKENGESGTSGKTTVPHSQVARAAHLALKSSAKAAQKLADAEDTQIRTTLASLIKLQLTKLELKMSQFEELEDILEEERRTLEQTRMQVMQERVSLKKMYEDVRNEIAKNGGTLTPSTLASIQPGASIGTMGQGPNPVPVQEIGDGGPVDDANTMALS